MKYGSGAYSTRFTWSQRSLGAPSTIGEVADVHTVSRAVWGRFDYGPEANSTEIGNSETQETIATIALRNYIDVKLRDWFIVNERTWEVLTVVTRENETVCTVIEV